MSDLSEKIQYLIDLEEIKKLKYKYCRYNDGGWHGQPLTHQGPSHELFTEDGVWDGSPIARAEGREAIRKLFDQFAAQLMNYHAVTNPIIDIEGNFARAHWHLIAGRHGRDLQTGPVALAGGDAPSFTSVLTVAGYEDEYVRTPDGWRIKLMRLIWGRKVVLPEGWTETIAAS